MFNLKKLRLHIGHYRLDSRFLKVGLPKLTDDEKRLLKETWPCVSISPFDYTCIRIYKKFNGFSPYYLGPMWYNYIRSVINPGSQLQSLENKAMCDVYFPQLNFPQVYIRGFKGGAIYDGEMVPISIDEAVQRLSKVNGFVIKPSMDSEQGRGVKKVTTADVVEIKKILIEAGEDFVVQEILQQHKSIAKLNETSLNSFRVTSIYLNGHYGSVTALKVGKKGAVRDNWNCSYWVNVENDGCLSENAYDYNLNIVKQTDNGIKFKGLQMPCYNEMMNFVEKWHKKLFPNCGVVGWDITIDNNCQIRVIETNLDTPGTKIEQLCNLDFFKPFRDDICSIMSKNK